MPQPLLYLLIATSLIGLTLAFFWPMRGILPRIRQARRSTERVLIEDTLKHLHNLEIRQRRATLESIAGAINLPIRRVPDLLETMQERELVELQNGDFHLTDHGRDYALHMIRAHRLWESYLADATGYGESDWHGQAEAIEHTLGPDEVEALAARLGNPLVDPHGDPIPTAEGEYVPHGGIPLSGVDVGQSMRIVHVEDEPETVYAQLVAEGLHPGQAVQVLEVDNRRIRLWADGNEHILAPMVAANVSVVPLPPEVSTEIAPSARLDGLGLGEMATIAAISRGCRGAERRRLMDLGIVPGTRIEVEMHSPSGDPTAYRIRDTIIALRKEQAKHIRIERAEVQGVTSNE